MTAPNTHRARLAARAAANGYPLLALAPHLAVMAGADAWGRYTTRASTDDIRRGIQALAARPALPIATPATATMTTTTEERRQPVPTQPKHSISHSQIEQFTQCPRRWKLTKIDRVPQAPVAALCLGDAVHQAIEADGTAWITTQKRLSYPQLIHTFTQALDTRLAHDDPTGLIADEQRFQLKRKGMAALHAYVEHVQARYQPLAVETPFDFPLPDDVEDGAATGWRFTGRIDAVTRPDGGPGTIVDWKVLGKPWNAGDEHGKEQACAYLLAEQVRETLDAPASRVTFITLPVVATPDGEGYACVPDARPTTRTSEQVRMYARHVASVAGQIEQACASGDFPARVGPLCGWCGCLGACSDGMRWLREHGRAPAVPVMRAADGNDMTA
ncbi:MAG: PD-(D/E)XK nuclease family protein [Ktedonobacterales bacterium]|nr:PD-(D/E)XK nuclease family protein [Ktedonobacterales bacterium]